ncbi:MAG TPA: DUF2203 family protein [Acidimicrobiales bacterium]|nr:DUF2203 family protein [Acidimicrobiales bacterium]
MRYWTVEEAREYLPRLRELLDVLQRASVVAGKPRTNGHGLRPGDDPEAAAAELAASDIVVRDPTVGLVDFAAVGEDDVVYFLCFRLDDADLAWWHLPEEGFPGRKPLPRGAS